MSFLFLSREEYGKLFDFVNAKKLNIKNRGFKEVISKKLLLLGEAKSLHSFLSDFNCSYWFISPFSCVFVSVPHVEKGGYGYGRLMWMKERQSIGVEWFFWLHGVLLMERSRILRDNLFRLLDES